MALATVLLATTNISRGDEQGQPGGAIVMQDAADETGHDVLMYGVSRRLYPDSAACAAVKLDLWVHGGRINYTAFPARGRDVNVLDPGDMIFGLPTCRIHVKIGVDPPDP